MDVNLDLDDFGNDDDLETIKVCLPPLKRLQATLFERGLDPFLPFAWESVTLPRIFGARRAT